MHIVTPALVPHAAMHQSAHTVPDQILSSQNSRARQCNPSIHRERRPLSQKRFSFHRLTTLLSASFVHPVHFTETLTSVLYLLILPTVSSNVPDQVACVPDHPRTRQECPIQEDCRSYTIDGSHSTGSRRCFSRLHSVSAAVVGRLTVVSSANMAMIQAVGLFLLMALVGTGLFLSRLPRAHSPYNGRTEWPHGMQCITLLIYRAGNWHAALPKQSLLRV